MKLDPHYLPGGKDLAGELVTPYLPLPVDRVAFLIRCAVCHTGLCKHITVGRTRRNNLILVEPCPNCLKAAQKGLPVKIVEVDDLDRELDKP